jgi:hypothetical protein
VYILNKETIDITKKYSWGLLSWVLPKLPGASRRFVFFRDHNTPWLVRINL